MLVVDLVEAGPGQDLAQVRVLEDEHPVGRQQDVGALEDGADTGDVAQGVGGVHHLRRSLGGPHLGGRLRVEEGAVHPAPGDPRRLEGEMAHPRVGDGAQGDAVVAADLHEERVGAAQFPREEPAARLLEVRVHHRGAGRVVRVTLVEQPLPGDVLGELHHAAGRAGADGEPVAELFTGRVGTDERGGQGMAAEVEELADRAAAYPAL